MLFDLNELADLFGFEIIVPGRPGTSPRSQVTGPAGRESRSLTFSGISTDSRNPVRASAFVALVAERDGHEFVRDALAGGCVGAIVDSRHAESVLSAIEDLGVNGPWLLIADDTMSALGDVGKLARRKLGAAVPVVAVTGSVGKTTVKDMIASVLSTRFPTSASRLSFNNEIGVPLTLANSSSDSRAVVVEMGARGAGHIEYLCEIAEPSIGVVTKVSHAHTEMFGSIEEVAKAKSELVSSLGPAGVAVLNGDDPLVAAMGGTTVARTIFYGTEREVRSHKYHGGTQIPHVFAESVSIGPSGAASFVLSSEWGRAQVALSAPGAHQVSNALAAASVGLSVGLTPEEVSDGLRRTSLSPMRMDMTVLENGTIVIDDSYNANPTSVEAALETLASLDVQAGRSRVAVLGPMEELGEKSEELHLGVAAFAKRMGVTVIAFDGGLGGSKADPGHYGVPVSRGTAELWGRLGDAEPIGAILFKASRAARLDLVARQFLDRCS